MSIEFLLKKEAFKFGITKIGICKPQIFKEHLLFKEWLKINLLTPFLYYIEKTLEQRTNLKNFFPWVESIIVCAFYYNTQYPLSIEVKDKEKCWISRYAWGEDYHRILRKRLFKFVEFIKKSIQFDFNYKICVDTSAATEKIYGKYAGIGWIGKNTLLINPSFGSYFFLGLILTSLALPPDEPIVDGCSSCTFCIDACPTNAINPEGFLEVQKCIAHLNNDFKGEIPFDLKLKKNLFGCDICQDVCPYNRNFILEYVDKTFEPFEKENFSPSIEEILKLNEADFYKRFGKTPVKRRTLPLLKRTAELIMKQSS